MLLRMVANIMILLSFVSIIVNVYSKYKGFYAISTVLEDILVPYQFLSFNQLGTNKEHFMRKIFVGGLQMKTTEKDLSLHFGQFGEIQFTNFKTYIDTGRSRGFAFVVFKTTEGRDHALACTNHVIHNKKVDVKKAVPRKVKIFVGGLSPYLTDDDIKDYFKRYAPLVAFEMPYDKVKNKRKSYCFIGFGFDSIQAVNEILKSPRHIIKGKKVDVKNGKNSNDLSMINNLISLNITQGNIWDQRGFPPQYGYAPGAFCYNYRGYNQFLGYSPNYGNTYRYPSYGGSARADY